MTKNENRLILCDKAVATLY